ncbi:hypothetical protein ACOI1H_11800 [Loktanella sp. DJP18]|uniref:hypothetical protein n=1 Tax=Loktanella sp. DJP18 TaxID=3409788 RepID=UPI003BB72EB4
MKALHIIAFACMFIARMAQADDLPEPIGPVVLTVTGQITVTNGNGVAEFDQAMLDGLPQRTTTATTPWLDGPHQFSGPTGAAILDAVGAKGQNLQIIALNDYAADVPAGDLTEFDVIFATAIDDKVLSVRDKGPLFLIYPFDDRPELYNEVYFGRSVWQINRIVVQD